jgi:DNA primase
MMSVRDVLDHYDIYYETEPHSSELSFLCPFHDDTKLGSARFDEDVEIFNCFSCGKGGNIFQFVASLENCDTKEASILLENNFETSQTYDFQNLSNFLEKDQRRKENKQRLENSKIAEKQITNVFKTLSTNSRGFLPLIQKWFSICVWISFNRSTNLDIYQQFFKEINDGRTS